MIDFLFWRPLAKFLARPAVVRRLIARAALTPYFHISSPDGQDVYMRRFWLFNPYERDGSYGKVWWGRWLPSIRLHQIMRADTDRHLHDHPWNARTIILSGGYVEEREQTRHDVGIYGRCAGDTATLKFGEFHRISYIPNGGTWTMFITWRYRGTWGFKVDGVKVPHREYFAMQQEGKL